MAGIQKMRGKDFVIAGSSLSTRFSELERFGVIKIIRTRPCKETGRLSLEWDVTQHLPIIPKKKQKQMCLMCNGKGYTDEVIEEQHVKEEQ
jgi:hypothetical protein